MSSKHVSSALRPLPLFLAFLPIVAEASGPGDSSHALDPLIYAHLVIECTIESVRHTAVTDAQMNLSTGTPDRKRGMLIAELSNVITLRGYGTPSEVVIGIDLSPRDLIGERMVLCCYWHPTLDLFTVWFNRLAFRREGDRWLNLQRVAGAAPEERVAVTSHQISRLIAKVEIPELTRSADVVVIGRVASLVDSTVHTAQGEVLARRIELDSERVLKGNLSTSSVWFLVASGPISPSWRTVTSSTLLVGETWIAFLRHEGDIFYPLGGVNGLLLLRDDKVFFDRILERPFSRAALTRAVVDAINE